MAGWHTALGRVENQWKSTHDLPMVSRRHGRPETHRLNPPAPHHASARTSDLPTGSILLPHVGAHPYHGRSVTAHDLNGAVPGRRTCPEHGWRLVRNDNADGSPTRHAPCGNTVLGGTGQRRRNGRAGVLR